MIFDLPIGLLISARQRELHMTSADLARRIGYRNVGKGVRRINELCRGNFRAAEFILDALPHALEVPEDDVRRAIKATNDQIAEEERRQLEAEEARYRGRFRPHVLWATERDRPTSITMVAFVGVERLLRFDLDVDQGQETFVAQAIAAMPSDVSFFGKVVGFYVNFSPDKCVQHDREGNVVATFPRARRAGWADVTLKGDSRSILPLLGVKAPER